MTHWRAPHTPGPIRHLGPAIAIMFAVAVIVIAGMAHGEEFVISDHALIVRNLNFVGKWIECDGGKKPLVTVTKHPTENGYQVIVECPNQPAILVPTS